MSKVVKSVVRSLPAAAIAFVASGFNPWAPAAVVASAVVAGALTKTPKLSSVDRPRSITVSSSVAPQLVVYGRTRVATVRAFAASGAHAGQANAHLHQVLLLCSTDADGIEEVESVYFGDEIVPLVREGDGWVPEAGHALAGAVYVEKYTGATGQVASASLAQAGVGWTADHRLQGIAYLYVRLFFDKQDGANVWSSGVPQISAVVKGQKVHDPRTGAKVWSNNFALCVRDFLLAPYGYACAPAEVDDVAMVAAANLSDEAVTLQGGGAHARYTLDGAVYLEGAPGEVVDEMLTAGLASMVYMRGAWRLYPAAYRPPAPDQLVLTADHLRDAPTIEIDPPRDAIANTVTGRYTDPATWQVSEFPQYQDADALAADGEELATAIDLPFAQNSVRGQRLAKIVQRQSRRGLVQWPGTYACLRLRVGETVAVTLPLLGWETKVFRVERWQLAANGLGIDLDLREEAPADYAWYPTEEMALPVPPDTSLPDPASVLPPAGFALSLTTAVLADGTVAPAFAVEIDPSPDAMAVDHLVRWREVDAASWQIATVPAGGARHQVAARDATTYQVSVAALSVRGVTSPWLLAQSITVAGGIAGARVAGLELFGQGLDTVWEGPDVRVVWRGVFPDTAAEIGAEAYGAGTGIANPYFLGYVVRVYDPVSGRLVREEPPQAAAEYTYRYDDNKRDGGPRRSVRIAVSIAPKVGAEIGTAAVTLTNPQPGLPANLSVEAVFGGVRLTYTPPADSDWTGILVYQGLAAGFAAGPERIVYRGPDTNITIPFPPGETRYFRAALVDAFGEDDLQLTQEFEVKALKIETQDLAAEIIGDDLLTEELKSKIDLVTAGADVPGSVASQVLTETQARMDAIAAEASARADALLAEAQARGTAITEERTARQTEDGALASWIVSVSAVADGAVAAVQTEVTTRANADEALASSITTQAVRLDSAEAAITTETTARVNADSALAGRATALEATVNNPATGLVATRARVLAEETARADADSALAGRATALEATVNDPATGLVVTRARVLAEETARADADSAMAGRIDRLVAQTGEGGFDAAMLWAFAGTTHSWAPQGAELWVTAEGWVRLGSTGVDPIIRSPAGVSLQGGNGGLVRARVRRVAGAGWDGRLYYMTAGHGENGTYSALAAAPAGTGWQVLEWDMSALADWRASTITRLRLDLGATAADVFDIEWIAVGRRGPAAYQAAVQQEVTARTNADSALASQISTLSATAGANTAAIEQEASVRAGADGQLFARYTVKVDVNGKAAGWGLASTANNGAVTSHFAVVADKFSVSRPGDAADQYVFVAGVHPVSGAPTLVLSGVVYADVINVNQLAAGNITASEIRLGAHAAGQPGIYLHPNKDGYQRINCFDGTRNRASMYHGAGGSGFESYDATGRKLFDSNDLGAGVASDRRFTTAAGSAVSRPKGVWADTHWYDGFVSRGNATQIVLTWDSVFTAGDGDTNPPGLRWRVIRRPQSFSGADVVIGGERNSLLGAAATAIVSEAAYSSGAADYYAIIFQTFRQPDLPADVDNPARVYRTAYANNFRMDMEWFR